MSDAIDVSAPRIQVGSGQPDVHQARTLLQDPPTRSTRLLQPEGRKEMFDLTTHSTHFIYGYMEGRKEMFYLTHSTHFIYSYMEGRKCFI